MSVSAAHTFDRDMGPIELESYRLSELANRSKSSNGIRAQCEATKRLPTHMLHAFCL